MRKLGSQMLQRIPGWWSRQEATTKHVIEGLSAVAVILVVAVVLVATIGNRSGTAVADASSTSLGAGAETTTETVPGDQAASTDTTTADETSSTDTISTDEASTTTATATIDTADHAADYRAQYPSTESFTNSNWATLDQAPASHLGAAVDVIGRVADAPTINSNTGYVTWNLSIPAAGGKETPALCRTNVNLDRTLLSAGGWVEVRGIAVGAQAAGASSGAAIYVETVTKASAPATTTAT
jgi:hypothetical protein